MYRHFVTPSRQLRRQQTRHEGKLWRVLRDRQMDGFKFRRQYVIGLYIVDFCCPEKKLVIEVDGGGHGEDAGRKKDEIRDKELLEQGWRVLRIWNSEVDENIEGVMEEILRVVVSPSPHSSPQRERRLEKRSQIMRKKLKMRGDFNVISSFSNWDQNTLDDLTTGTSFGGDVSGAYNNIVISDNSHNHTGTTIAGLSSANFTTANISQWTNDAGYITDGNTGWDNSYGLITDGNTGWDNSYGFVTSGDLSGWDANASDDFTQSQADTLYASLSHNHDASYINVTGDTMTGALNVPKSTGGNWNVGNALSDHENRIDALEGGTSFSDISGQIAASQVPQYLRPVAFGHLKINAAQNRVDVTSDYNLQSTGTLQGSCLGGNTGTVGRVSFSSSPSNSSYIVQLTPTELTSGGNLPGTPVVTTKTTNYFEFCMTTSIEVDVVVFHR